MAKIAVTRSITRCSWRLSSPGSPRPMRRLAALRPPVPCLFAVVRMHAAPSANGRPLLRDVVRAVPREGPGHAGAHHRGAQILTITPAQADRALVTVAAAELA